MRQRRVGGIEEKLAEYADLILKPETEPEAFLPNGRPVRWYQRGSGLYGISNIRPRVFVEFGCGRGLFINTLAAEDAKSLYIGAEGCKTIVYKALRNTRSNGLTNVRYIDTFINNAAEAFEENSLDGIFLNFSDPWPKDRHAERRLTAPRKAGSYLRILKPEGFVTFKTDGEDFFDYSHGTFKEAGFSIEYASRDLPSRRELLPSADDIATLALNTPTEYELRFRALKLPIYAFIAKKP